MPASIYNIDITVNAIDNFARENGICPLSNFMDFKYL
jgi:hypothetical protein